METLVGKPVEGTTAKEEEEKVERAAGGAEAKSEIEGMRGREMGTSPVAGS